MTGAGVGRIAAGGQGALRCERHRPEQTLLYQWVEQYYPRFLAELETKGHTLPRSVQREFEDYLKCGRLEHGFLRVRCETCHHEMLVAFSCKRRGFCPSCGAKRMVESAALLVDSEATMTRWRARRDSRCTRGCGRGRMIGRNWNGCAGTLPGRRCRTSALR